MAAGEHREEEKANAGRAPARGRPLTAEERRQIRVLKAVVIALGVLLVAGLVLLLVTVIVRGGGREAAPLSAAMSLPVPAGARIGQTTLSGHLLALHLRLKDGGEEVVVIDVRNGRVLRRIRLTPTGQ